MYVCMYVCMYVWIYSWIADSIPMLGVNRAAPPRDAQKLLLLQTATKKSQVKKIPPIQCMYTNKTRARDMTCEQPHSPGFQAPRQGCTLFFARISECILYSQHPPVSTHTCKCTTLIPIWHTHTHTYHSLPHDLVFLSEFVLEVMR